MRFHLTNRINKYLQESAWGEPLDDDTELDDDDWDDDDEDEDWDDYEGEEDEEYGEDADDWKDKSVGAIPNRSLRYFQRQLDRAYKDGLMDGYDDAKHHLSSLYTTNLIVVAGLFLLTGALLPIVCKALLQ